MLLTAAGCAARRTRLIEAIDADLIVISTPEHLLYLSGWYATPNALSGRGRNYLLIDTTSGKSTFLAHSFSFLVQQEEEVHVDEIVRWQWYDSMTESATMMFPESANQLQQAMLASGARRIAVETGSFPLINIFADVEDVTETLLNLRRVKDNDELEAIKFCIRAVEAGHVAARKTIRPGITEIDVYNQVNAAIVKAAGRPIAPMGDFVSGDRLLFVGGAPTSRVLQPGETMIIDIFPRIDGYRADLTATYPVTELDINQRELQQALHTALQAAETTLKPGSKAKDIYRQMKLSLRKQGFDQNFIHHAGHGLGIGHPESPYLVGAAEDVLQAGDVITLEPGAYGLDFGARIEHNYLITETGYERMSNHETEF